MNEQDKLKDRLMTIMKQAFRDGYYLGKNSTPNNEVLEQELRVKMAEMYSYKLELLLRQMENEQ